MNINVIKQVVIRKGSRGLLVAQKHSPVILTATGILGGITSAVMASKATLKLEETLEENKMYIEVAKERVRTEEDYGQRAYSRDLSYGYARGTIAVVKLYGPSISLGVASIGCIIGAQGIMQKRNVALVAAYSAVEKGFSEYRKRVEEVLGVDEERKIRYNVKELAEVKDEQTGEITTAATFNDNMPSMYARFFDEASPEWQKRPDFNLAFLRCQQNWANDMLVARGHIFLNEVYDALGMDRTPAGAIVGWVLGKGGDDHVDFGLYRGNTPALREFVNGHERSILLDFNVDGPIYEHI